MIKNLNQLKKSDERKSTVPNHCPLPKRVHWRDPSGDAGEHDRLLQRGGGRSEDWTRTANQGLGLILWWNRAPFWSFQDGVCSAYDSDTTHTEDHLIMSFRILDEQEAAA